MKPAALALALAGAFAAPSSQSQSLPTGGIAIHGTASISRPAANQLVVTTQNGVGTGHSAINWQSFSISAGSSMRFDQPSAGSLSINRVVTNTPSAIFGNLSSNGRLVLVNQSGITVGAGAVIDTAGFTASALRMTDADALAGRLRFGDAAASMGGAAGITVDGRITARDGDVVLVAPQIGVGDSALLQAANGSTILAAGQQVEITERGLEGITMLVQARESEARNLGRLEGGAVGIFAGTLRHSGEIQATTASLEGGKVVLQALGGATIDGSARVLATGSRGGQIDVLGQSVTVVGETLIDTSGTLGGGSIRVGGDYQGKNAQIRNADTTVLGAGAVLRADATGSGDGGRVIVWADDLTQAYGSVSARGGATGGNGGFAEISGKDRLDFQAQVDLRAPHGQTGTLLLDPLNIIIGATADINGDASTGDDVTVAGIGSGDFPGVTSLITAAQVSSLLNGANLSLAATNDITVSQAITKTTGAAQTLTLDAGNAININAAISGSSGFALGLTLLAGGNITVAAPINTFGGALSVTGSGAAATMTVSDSVQAAAMTLNLAGGLTVQSGAQVATLTAGANQTISAANIQVLGGASGSNASASIKMLGAAGTQDITASNGITITGGADGGGIGVGNSGSISSDGNQFITVGNGGITLTGGGGSLSENFANIEQNGGAGTTQSITVNGTGSIVLTGGSAAGSDSHASILTDNGDSQTITFTGGGAGRAITLTGGTIGSTAQAEIYSGIGTQTITGVGLITLTGGASGGGASLGGGDLLSNIAAIAADLNHQTIVADGIVVQGGAAGLNNLAAIYGGGNQSITVGAGGLSLTGGGGGGGDAKNAALVWKGSDVPGTSQTITVGGSGTVTLQGGSASTSNVGIDAIFNNLSNGAFAAIRSEGISQLIEFTAPGGSIAMTGGTVGSDNHARIDAITGTQTIRGDIATHAPAISLQGGASGGVGGAANEGNRALIFALAGNQAITASSINLTGGATGNDNLAQLRQGDTTGAGNGSTQTITITGGGDLTMQAGGGTFNVARIRAHGTTQTVQFSAPGSSIDITGGSGGVDNLAQILANNGSQTVGGVTAADAPTITLQGGSAGLGNMAEITAPGGSQTISVGAGGLSLTGGSGAINDLRNFVSVYQGGLAGHSQTINVGGGGDITLQAGSSASSGIGVNNGSLAYITSQGDQQLIEFGAPGSTISITGGTVGSYNTAGFYAFNGNQVVRGTTAANAPAIVMAGGASGGIVGEGNFAEMTAALGSQTVQAASIALTGGATGTDNLARISQLGTAGTSQAITIVGGGSASLLGGVGVTNLAQFRSLGDMQTVDFAAGGALTLTGGTGASLNYARIEAVNGNQVIGGAPDITITGGASGGAATLGNFAQLRARNAGTQAISASSLTIVGGAGGVENNAGIRNDATQTVTLSGAASSNAIVIGAAGAANESFITGNNQIITAGTGVQSGSITIHGGTEAGKDSGIFNNVGAQTVSTSGNLSITGGSAVGSSNLCDVATGGSCAMISNNGAGLLTVTTGTGVLIQGGNAGVGNIAGIFVNAGDLTLNVGGNLNLIGGTGTSTNSASIGGDGSSGRTQTFNVTGNVTLDASNGTDASSAFIGLGGTGDLGTTVVDINSGGNVTLIGSNVSATSGAAIGAGSAQTNAMATVTIDAVDIVLNAGSTTGARIGHNSAANGPGNITLNATGNVALNSNGAVGTAIITTGNVTINAGGTLTEGASSRIAASLLTASAGANMLLDSPLNQVTSLNATVPFFNTGDLFFTNALGTTLTVTGVAMAGTGKTARITADDLNITGAVSNIGGPVILRPLDLARNVHVENSPSGGVLSLSPADLQLVTNATVLEIGRLDGTGTLSVFNDLANANVNANALRLLTGTDYLHTSGASIGSAATPFAHDLEIRAGNHLQLTNGNIFLLDNKSMKLYADDDGSTFGSVNIGAGTFKVGTGAGNTTGLMDIKGADITVAVSGDGSGLIEVTGSGSQTFTATDFDLQFLNLNATSGNLLVRTGTGAQTLSAAAGALILQAGTGTGSGVSVGATTGSQSINADAVSLQGGASGFGNTSSLFAGGAAQTIAAGSGGVSLTGGGGTGADGNNSAIITYGGTGTQGVSIAGTGDLTITGGSSAAQNVGAGNGSRAFIESTSTGNQTITLASGNLTLQGGSVGSRNYAALFNDLGSQTITLTSGILSAVGGDSGGVAGEGNRATIQAGVNQNISAFSIDLTGGDDGTENYARILLFGAGAVMQTIGATGISVTGGAAGGGFGTGNFAAIQSDASQTVSVQSGGFISIAGGSGLLTDNFAKIEQNGVTGTQTINVDSGFVTLQGGSSLATTVGSGHGSRAMINANGTAQSILFTSGGVLQLDGGTAGQRNFAMVQQGVGSQTISGAGAILMTGGAAGGFAGEGNGAYINSVLGNQTVSAGAFTLTGGAAGTENLAQIRQGSATEGLGANQTINVLGSGPLTLDGGAGDSNLARIQAFGTGQTINMGPAAALTLTGGTGASFNFARIQAVSGNQSITGAPNITVNGGASGGADLAGNFADIRASGASSVQTIAANDIVLQAGAAGQENYAGIHAPNQTITALGDVSLTSGGSLTSLDGTSGGGARIGGFGGGTPSATNLDLTVGNNLILTGGSVSGASLGSNRVGGQTTNIIVNAGGNITLNPGSVATAGSRIGSPASGLAGGDIFLSAGGSITLGGTVADETAIRTLGDVTLDATTLAIGNRVAGSTIFANAAGAVAISGVGLGQLNATAASGDAIEVVAGTSFTNTAGAAALLTSAPARWLVYSSDPSLDTRGGLVYAFKQYDKTFGDANPILGTGNGFLYAIAPTATVSLTGVASKVYDGTNAALLAAGNFLALGGIDGDVVAVTAGASGSYDTRHVGTGKTVSVSSVAIDALDGVIPVYGYALAGGTATGAIGTITAAPLNVTTTDVNKVYDSTTTAAGTPVVSSGTLFAGDTLNAGTYAFLDPNAGTGKTVTVSGFSVNDGNTGANYSLTQVDNTTSSISAANLTLSTSNVVKTYDATTGAAGSLIVTSGSLFGSDSVSGGTFAFADKNAGTGKTVTTSGATVTDGNSGANYSVTYANNTGSTINRADISNVTGIVASNKVYDGTTSAALVTSAVGFTGAFGGDVLTVASATGNFADRNAGVKTVNVSAITLGGAGAGNYNLLDPTSSTLATISKANITISTTAVSKPYDGSTSAAGNAVVTSGALVGGDTLGSASFAFADKNVGTGKTVNVTSALINDGNTGANYNVTLAPNLLSSITALAVSTWSGSAGDSLWSSPTNWDVVPETGNVLAVTIPSGAGSVVFDASAGTTSLQSLTSARPVSVTGGNLQIGTLLQTGSYSQSGGLLSGAGTLSVTDSFTQSGGSIVLGAVSINQSSGNLNVGSVSAPVIALSAPAGMIVQSGPLTGGGSLTAASLAGTTLTNAGNRIGSFVAGNSGSGDIQFVNTGVLALGAVANAGGNIDIVNTGAIATAGTVSAPAGNVSITANSPLTIGAGGITAGGDIILNATNLTSAGDLTLNGPLFAGNMINLAAGNAMVQNFAVFGTNGVSANAGTSMTYGPLAITNNPPVLYQVAGVAVAPPPTVLSSSLQAPGDILVTFLDLFQQAIDGQLGVVLELNPDGSLKLKDVDGIVTEEQVCR